MDDLSRQVIGGYEIRQRIGRGGFGAVYRAYQPAIDREVAIKVILSEYANKPNFIRNFEIEAQLVARLEHPHIVPLFDFWRDSRGAYIVMRLLRGGSLLELLRDNGPCSIETASGILDDIASALTVAHKNGIVHQDMKTANVLLDEEGNAYLTDFGIAKDTKQESPDAQIMSPTGELYGSPEYMAPEQILRSVVDERADIYSLGIVLFEMLTGQKPFNNPDDEELVRDQLYKPLPPLHTVNPDLPEGIDEVIQRATDKHPRRRYATAMDLADNFRKFVTQTSPVLVGADNQMINPYKGLRAFHEADASDFFGREILVEQLFRRMNESRFLAVVGASGSGKSSLVRAGLMPLIRRHNRDRFLMVMAPGAKPLEELEAVLNKASLQENVSFGEILRRDAQGLHESLKKALGNFVSELVLTIDQFEEVFTLVTDETERKLFIDGLVHAVTAPDSRLRLVITMRADFLDRPLQYPGLNELLAEYNELVIPMKPAEIERAVIKPAERVGLRVEDALVKAIVNEVSNQPGTLPLLQYALTELFNKRSGTLLTAKSYFDTGGVSGAMIRRAEEIYGDLNDENSVRQLFLRLVTLGEGTEDTRRRTLLTELLSLEGSKQAMQRVIDEFGKYRLLSFDHDPQNRLPTVEIAHEAMIRNWQRLRDWLNKSRDELRLQYQLATATALWKGAGKDPSYLAQGGRLEQLEAVLDSKVITISADERAFLDASIYRRKRSQRRRNMVFAGLFILAMILAGLTLFSVDRERRAQEARVQAETARQQADIARLMSLSRELAVTAIIGINQFDTALLLSIEALHAAETFEARNTLLTVIQSAQSLNAQFERFLPGHTDAVRAVTVQGDLAVTGGRDGRLGFWNLATGEGETFDGHSDWINTVDLSRDGSRLASAGRDNRIVIWDTETRQPVYTVTAEGVWRVAFSPDGQWLASAGIDGLRLWDMSTGEGERLSPDSEERYSVAWGGDLLASGDVNGQITLWDMTNREIITTIEAHGGGVWALRFSPDSRFLASGGEDNGVKLWTVETGEPALEFPVEHTAVVRDLAFHSSGRFIVSASDDATVRVWDITTGQRAFGFQSITGGKVRSIALTADDKRLIAGTDLSSGLVWTLQGRNRLGELLQGHTQPVTNVAYFDGQVVSLGNDVSGQGQNALSQIRVWNEPSQVELPEETPRLVTASIFSGDKVITADFEGRIRWNSITTGETINEITASTGVFSLAVNDQTLAAGGTDGSIRLWKSSQDSWTPQAQPFAAHEGRVFALALSPDGSRLASGGADSLVQIWTLASGEPLTLTGHTGPITTLAFSPDGRLLASGDRNNTILVWDTQTGALVQSLTSHVNWILSLAFSPDGSLLASGSRDRSIILWDLSEFPYRQLGTPLVGHVDEVNSVVFSGDGQHLVSGGKDGAVMVWEVSIEAWERIACQTVNRNLTETEWRQYLRDLPYHPTCLRINS